MEAMRGKRGGGERVAAGVIVRVLTELGRR